MATSRRAAWHSLTLCGYLDNHRNELSHGYYEHRAWGAHVIADDATARNIVTAYDPEGAIPTTDDVFKPPLKFNMSGCSGGLAVLVRNVDSEFQWTPAAVIYRGPTGASEGGFAAFDLIHLRPLSFILSDGTIDNPEVSWLPQLSPYDGVALTALTAAVLASSGLPVRVLARHRKPKPPLMCHTTSPTVLRVKPCASRDQSQAFAFDHPNTSPTTPPPQSI